jgi:uncharacterized phiE125 gp8 family phage protein
MEPITTAEAMRHLRLDADDPYLDDLDAYITAARQTVEQYLNASVAVQERTLVLDAFPAFMINLPNGPLISVTSVTYIDTDGIVQTVDSGKYVARSLPLSDILFPDFGESWPATRAIPGAVTITYQAGMMIGSPLMLPHQDIRAAILLTLGDLWENREGAFVGTIHAVNPTVERLLHYHRRQLGI